MRADAIRVGDRVPSSAPSLTEPVTRIQPVILAGRATPGVVIYRTHSGPVAYADADALDVRPGVTLTTDAARALILAAQSALEHLALERERLTREVDDHDTAEEVDDLDALARDIRDALAEAGNAHPWPPSL